MSETFRGGRKKPGREYTRYARDVILDRLASGDLTVAQMARLCQRDRATIYRVLGRLKEQKLIHISEWKVHEVGPHESVWSLGDEKDEPNPPRQPSSVRCRRLRARKRPPQLVRRDPLLAALMGGCRDSTMAE